MALQSTDVLTGASLGVQKLSATAFRTLGSAAFAGVVLARAAGVMPVALQVAAAAAFLPVLVSAVLRRVGRLKVRDRASTARLDLELCTLASVPLLLAVTETASAASGPLMGLLYLGLAAVCAWCRPAVGVASWAFVAVFFALLHRVRPVADGWAEVSSLVLLGLVGALTAVALHLRVKRAEQASRDGLQSELQKVRDVARSYRLMTTTGGRSSAVGQTGEDEQLLRSSVEEIHEALRSALSLCRVSLGARTVLALWLDASGQMLHLRGASSDEPVLQEGPFRAKEGIFGAALGTDLPLELVGPPAARPLPYYPAHKALGHVVAFPLLEAGAASGLLVLDREAAQALRPEELSIVTETARLVQRTVDNERVFLQLDRAKVEQGKLYRAVERLNEVRSEVDVIQAGVASAREFAAFHFAAVTLLRSGGTHEICAVSGAGADELVGKTFRDPAGLVGMVTDNQHPLPYRGQCNTQVQVVFTRRLPTPSMPSLLVLPLLVHREVLGTLVLGSNTQGAFGNAERLTLQVLARHMAVSLANARMVKRLEELATTDGLTGLLNKRALSEVARQKLRSACRFDKPLSVLICDLDHFKLVNDTHGHDVGDRVIVGFSDVLKRTKRETDAVGRFGGEEFVLICEQTDVSGAELLAERIRAELAATTFVTPAGALNVSASVGVATYPQAEGDWDTLFKAADEALYASKRGGRDRVTVWTADLGSRAAG